MVHRLDDFGSSIGLGIERAPDRNVADLDIAVPGNDDDPNGRPPICYRRGKHQAIHRAGHVHIGDDEPNIITAFQKFDSRRCIGCFEHDKTRGLEIVHQRHADERLVLNHENDCWGCHGPSISMGASGRRTDIYINGARALTIHRVAISMKFMTCPVGLITMG